MTKRTAELLLLLVCVVGAIGCGAGDPTSTTEATKDPFAGYPKGPTRQFILPGGDNAVQEYGHEATAAERRQASAVVEAWLRARVRGEWAKACSYLHEESAAYAITTGSEVSGKELTSCAQGYAALVHNAETPRDNIKGGVASLRIESGHGFAQYHGKEGRDWVLSVVRGSGDWKVASLYPIDRTK
jgi:hypothetical protein